MTKRLLVGIADTTELNAPRQYLLDVLAGLRDLGVEVDVAAFADGPVLDELGHVATVHRLEPLAHRTAGAAVQTAAGRLSDALAGQVQDVRTRASRALLGGEPDCIHLHGVWAMPVLRLVRSPDVPVTVYVHPWDHGILGLPPRDRRHLVERADRFLVADDSVVAQLLEAGVERSRIEPAPGLEDGLPDPVPSAAARARARAEVGLPAVGSVVAVPPVPDWADMPDLTLGLAWEVARRGGEAAPSVVWWGMPAPDERPWPLDHELDHLGLARVHLVPDELAWDDAVELADLIALPVRSSFTLPGDFAATAARRATPLLCWEGHPQGDELARWGGTVVERADVAAMADRINAAVADPAALRGARMASWRLVTAEVERLVPVGVETP